MAAAVVWPLITAPAATKVIKALKPLRHA